MSAEWGSYVLGLLSSDAQMRTCLYRLTRNREDTEELLQETYTKLLSIDRGKIHGIRHVLAFALVAAKRTGIDWLRHRKRVQIDCIDDLDARCLPGAALTEDLVNAYQKIERVLRKAQRLPPRCGEVYALRTVLGFSQKEIAPLLGISVHTVEQHLLKARRAVGRVGVARASKRERALGLVK